MSSPNGELIDQQRTLIETLQKEATTRQGPTNSEANANAIEASIRALLLLEGKQPSSL